MAAKLKSISAVNPRPFLTLVTALGLNEVQIAKAGGSKRSKKPSTGGLNASGMLYPCSDGERTERLTSLIGKYFASGFNDDQVVEHCRMWNKDNTPPLDDAKIISTIRSMALTDARNHPERNRNNAASQLLAPGPITPLFDIADAKIDRFLTTAPPEQRWVLDGFLPLGIVAALVAQGGAGKSQLLMQLAYSVAVGVPVAGNWAVGESGSVLMLCAEDGDNEIHRRVSRIHQQLGAAMTPAMRKQLMKNLLIRSMIGADTLMTEATRNGEVSRTQLAERLLLTANQINDLKLIIIDPASRFRGGDENSNAHATRFVQALEYLAQSTGATVLIAHHTNKGAINSNETNQTSSRGASALTDGIRWQMALTPLTQNTKGYGSIPNEERHSYLEAKVVKTNYTAPQPVVLLNRCRDGYMQAVVGAIGGHSRDTDAKLRDILRIVKGSATGMTARQVEIQHGGLDKTLKVSQRNVRDLLVEAQSRGLLEGASGKPLKVTSSGLAILESTADKVASAARRVPRGTAARRTKT
jgi:RecA-family ATPase